MGSQAEITSHDNPQLHRYSVVLAFNDATKNGILTLPVPSHTDSDPVLPSLSLDILGQRGKTTPKSGERPPSARPGDVIGGRYVIDGQIGRGGMGRVLKVRHMVLDKAFALKLPKARYATDVEQRERFYREARLASSLDHVNIGSIVDFGDDPNFGLFMVMNLLDGIALKDKLKQDGRLSPRTAADVMTQIAEATRYVHSQGIVHGDIKPDNILLVKTADRHRLVKLLDFGLAQPQSSKGDGSVRGTPAYLAPERIRKEPASVASDIYALGILFYELLVGTPPFTGTTTDILRAHLDDTVAPPSTLIADDLDERADLIVLRATAKDPGDRHPNVSSFLYELNAFCDMHGFSTTRRRGSDSTTLVKNAASHAAKAGAELFELAPIPLAAVSRDGTIRMANHAFLKFIGQDTITEDLRLPQTPLIKVYPRLVQDLATVSSTGTTVKETFTVSSGEGERMNVAIIISAPPSDDCANSGEIHIALHPLGCTETKTP
ncbi:MAG: protein kinase [Kofleriaceae bacterium]|nr:protein kinase [Kofleriaceae bacterium]